MKEVIIKKIGKRRIELLRKLELKRSKKKTLIKKSKTLN